MAKLLYNPDLDKGRVSRIASKSRDSGQDIGCIMVSDYSRITEIEATRSPTMPSHDPDKLVLERKPYPDAHWCSGCGWRPQNRFYKNKARATGYNNYCIDCCKRLHEKSQVLSPSPSP